MASHSAYEIAADSDEEEGPELISTSASSLLPPAHSSSNQGQSQGKGKGRAMGGTGGGVEGRIGSNSSSNASFGERRQTIGGIQTETR